MPITGPSWSEPVSELFWRKAQGVGAWAFESNAAESKCSEMKLALYINNDRPLGGTDHFEQNGCYTLAVNGNLTLTLENKHSTLIQRASVDLGVGRYASSSPSHAPA